MSQTFETPHVAAVAPSASELEHTLTQFFLHLDRSSYAALLALTHARFRWHRQGKILDGHTDVLAALNERPSTQRVVHVITNAVVEDATPASITLGAYMTAYRSGDGPPPDGPATIAGPLRLSRVTTRFEAQNKAHNKAQSETPNEASTDTCSCASGWLITEQILTPLFSFGAQ
ncbi:hypothetical protein [Paraburkholderia sp. ZP32-5]|uniref:hypothetical protein n=1 Tax=Paraburkholderia sp. ZP32-5 TaxID=2883245 RepID=UPI001F483B08|nr:hypothetical protein [Paraburkholderia sp. ZP32-5]